MERHDPIEEARVLRFEFQVYALLRGVTHAIPENAIACGDTGPDEFFLWLILKKEVFKLSFDSTK